MSDDDIVAVEAFLSLISNVRRSLASGMIFSQVAQSSEKCWRNFLQSPFQPIEKLFALLSCPVPARLKAALVNTISAFTTYEQPRTQAVSFTLYIFFS